MRFYTGLSDVFGAGFRSIISHQSRTFLLCRWPVNAILRADRARQASRATSHKEHSNATSCTGSYATNIL